MTPAVALSCAARASCTSVIAIRPTSKRFSACSSWRLNGLQRRLRGGQRVLGGEHVEIGLRRRAPAGPAGRRDSSPRPARPAESARFRCCHWSQRNTVCVSCGAVVPVLADVGRALVADRDDVARCSGPTCWEGRLAVGIGRVDLAVEVDLRQQQRPRLGLGLERGHAARIGLADHRVALDRGLVDLEQVLGAQPVAAPSRAAATPHARTEDFLCMNSPSGGRAAQLVN